MATKQQQDIINLVCNKTPLVKVSAVAGSGKALPLSSGVLTVSGYEKMKDVYVGQTLLHPLGGTTQITGVYPQGKQRVYILRFDDGTETECCKDHLWSFYDNREGTKVEDRTLQTASTLDLLTKLRERKKRDPFRYYLPPHTVDHPTKNLIIEPYLLGVLLAKAQLTGVACSLLEKEDTKSMIEKCEGLLKGDSTFTKTEKRMNEKGNKYVKIAGFILQQIEELGINVKMADRFIPEEYFTSSTYQRSELLRGLMDASGVRTTQGKDKFISASPQLSKDVVKLVQSLGGVAKEVDSKVIKNRNSTQAIQMKFKDLYPYYSYNRKVAIWDRQPPRRYLVKVTATDREVLQQCIKVDREDGLFMTDNYVVTHNTYTLVEATKALKPSHGIYLAYNKAIAIEATNKFKGTNVECSTIHSLAYRAVVRKYGLKVGIFKPRDVQKVEDYEDKVLVHSTIETFCLSGYTDINKYLKECADLGKTFNQIVIWHIGEMAKGKIESSHSFYLKLYHIMLTNGSIPLPTTELLMLDEFGDITALTIEVFKLIKAETKIAVGDSNQNIYSFNNTINGFEHLKNEGELRVLDESFRTIDSIAQRIEGFCQRYLDPDMEFKGQPESIVQTPKTFGYIHRTNGAMIATMFRMQEMRKPFSVTRKASVIFALPMTLMNLKKGCKVFDQQYKFIENDVKTYFNDEGLLHRFKSPLAYIYYKHAEDIEIKSAQNLFRTHSFSSIYDIYKVAKAYEKDGETYPIVLTTIHSSKG